MRPLLTPVLALTALLAAAVAPRLVGAVTSPPAPQPPPAMEHGPVVAASEASDSPALTITLDRSSVTAGGQVRAQLMLQAPVSEAQTAALPTDVVLVIDRSGSMQGDKMHDARRAAQELLGLLGPQDRAAIISFSDSARVDLALQPVSGLSYGAIDRLHAAGGTEMQAGLDQALAMVRAPREGRSRRVLLLSDGRPNTRDGLVERAARAAAAETPLTAVGIGADYDVQLMQSMADAGTGNFYWARADLPLSTVFADEFRASRAAVTASTELRIDGGNARVLDWGGLPGTDEQVALGQLFSGQRRSLWVTLQVDHKLEPSQGVELGQLQLSWTALDGSTSTTRTSLGTVDLVASQAEVLAGLNGDHWADAVVDDEYNVVLGEISNDLARGDKQAAMNKLNTYQQRNENLNARVQSAKVYDNLAEVEQLQQQIADDQVGKLGLLDLASKAWSGRRKGQTFGSMPAPAPR